MSLEILHYCNVDDTAPDQNTSGCTHTAPVLSQMPSIDPPFHSPPMVPNNSNISLLCNFYRLQSAPNLSSPHLLICLLSLTKSRVLPFFRPSSSHHSRHRPLISHPSHRAFRNFLPDCTIHPHLSPYPTLPYPPKLLLALSVTPYPHQVYCTTHLTIEFTHPVDITNPPQVFTCRTQAGPPTPRDCANPTPSSDAMCMVSHPKCPSDSFSEVQCTVTARAAAGPGPTPGPGPDWRGLVRLEKSEHWHHHPDSGTDQSGGSRSDQPACSIPEPPAAAWPPGQALVTQVTVVRRVTAQSEGHCGRHNLFVHTGTVRRRRRPPAASSGIMGFSDRIRSDHRMPDCPGPGARAGPGSEPGGPPEDPVHGDAAACPVCQLYGDPDQ
eukprot:766937-Hanusia_phi.AAC.4